MFAQTTREMPEWVTVLKQFKNLKCASFLFVAWFMGFGIGLIFTFLFWHLQVPFVFFIIPFRLIFIKA